MKQYFQNPKRKRHYVLLLKGNIYSSVLILLTLFSFSISSQTIVKETELGNIGFVFDTPFNILGVNNDSDSYTLYINQLRGLYADDPQTKKPILKEMNNGYPALYAYKMDKNFNIRETKNEGVHLTSLGINKPYILENLNHTVFGDNLKDKTYEQIALEYPGSYVSNYGPFEYIELRRLTQFKNYGIGATIHKFILDNACDVNFDISKLPQSLTPEQASFSMSGLTLKPNEKALKNNFPVEDAKLFSIEEPFTDILRNSITFDVYAKRKNAQKNDEFKEHYLLTYNKEGQISQKINLTFDIPSEVRCQTGIVEKYLYDTIPVYKGFLFIYGAIQGFGRTLKDVDYSAYEAVYLDPNGRKVFQYKFKFGDPKLGIACVHAFEDNGIIYFLAKEGLNYSLIKFGKDSILNTKPILRDIIYKNSKEIPAGGRISCDISEINNISSQILPNKDIVIYGTSYDKVFNTLFLNILHLSNSGDIIDNYSINFNPDDFKKTPLHLDLVHNFDNKLVMMYKRKMGLLSDTFQRVGISYSYVAKQGVKDPDYNFREHPVIITLDAEKRKLDILNYSRPFYTSLSGRKYYNIIPKENSLLLFGINTKASYYPSNLIITKLSF